MVQLVTSTYYQRFKTERNQLLVEQKCKEMIIHNLILHRAAINGTYTNILEQLQNDIHLFSNESAISGAVVDF